MWFPIEKTNAPITCQSPLNGANASFFLSLHRFPRKSSVSFKEFNMKHSKMKLFVCGTYTIVWHYKSLFQNILPIHIIESTTVYCTGCVEKWLFFSWETMIIMWLHCISLYNYILIISGCARKSLCERHGSRRLHLKSEGDLAKGQKGKVDYTGLPHCQKQDHMNCTATIGGM